MDLDRVDFRKLRAFHLVAQLGNLRLAAGRLNQTIPAVSAKIRLLEEDLGFALFERLPNRLRLTEMGQRFMVEVQAILTRTEQALDSVVPSATHSGRLTVSIGSDCAWYVAPRISRFLTRNPDVELDLQVLRGAEAIGACMRGDVDISIGVFAKVPSTLDRRVLIETPLSLVCAQGHPLLSKRRLSLRDVVTHKLIVHPRHGATRRLVDRVMANHGAKPRSIIEVANCRLASTFVEMNAGVAIVHSLCIAHETTAKISSINLERLFGRVPFRAVFRKAHRRPLVDALLDGLLDEKLVASVA